MVEEVTAQKDLKQMEAEYHSERNKQLAKKWDKRRKFYLFLQIIYSVAFAIIIGSFSYIMGGMEALRDFGYWQALIWQNLWLLLALARWMIEEKNYNKNVENIEK